MYDDRFDRYDPYDDLDRRSLRDLDAGYGSDARLLVQVYVDGRPVDAWCGPVRGTRWQEWAERFELERRPEPKAAPAPPAPEIPAPVRVLRWLDGLVGGREALLSLTTGPGEDVTVSLDDPASAEAFAVVSGHLERVCTELFDDEVLTVCERVLATLIDRGGLRLAKVPANELAAGVIWLVGKANGLFTAGITQQAVQRELWLRRQLSTSGRAVQSALGGINVHAQPRPGTLPDLRPVGDAAVLTAATRTLVVRWRDEALAASEEPVLPTEVES